MAGMFNKWFAKKGDFLKAKNFVDDETGEIDPETGLFLWDGEDRKDYTMKGRHIVPRSREVKYKEGEEILEYLPLSDATIGHPTVRNILGTVNKVGRSVTINEEDVESKIDWCLDNEKTEKKYGLLGRLFNSKK